MEEEPQPFDDYEIRGFTVYLYYKGRCIAGFDIEEMIEQSYEYVGCRHKPISMTGLIDI